MSSLNLISTITLKLLGVFGFIKTDFVLLTSFTLCEYYSRTGRPPRRITTKNFLWVIGCFS